MTAVPKYAPCHVTLEFGDGEYLFRLPCKQIAELQEKCNAGIGTIYQRVFSGNYYIADLVETVRLGLIGGKLDVVLANRLVANYVDDMPKSVLVELASAILLANLAGYKPADGIKKKERRTRKAGLTSRKPTSTEP